MITCAQIRIPCSCGHEVTTFHDDMRLVHWTTTNGPTTELDVKRNYSKRHQWRNSLLPESNIEDVSKHAGTAQVMTQEPWCKQVKTLQSLLKHWAADNHLVKRNAIQSNKWFNYVATSATKQKPTQRTRATNCENIPTALHIKKKNELQEKVICNNKK